MCTYDPNDRGETVRKMAAEALHMISHVTTADRSLNMIDCVMSSDSGMYSMS